MSSNKPRRKLIESAFPVTDVNREAAREKHARSCEPGNIHIWWNRRPLGIARSVLFASCVDDPGEHPELFPTLKAQMQERKRLVRMTAALSAPEAALNYDLLRDARSEMRRHTKEDLPTVFDPFAGGGAVPVEAQRLGMKVESSDLNPVAVMITKLSSDIPSRFADLPPVGLGIDFSMYMPQNSAGNSPEDCGENKVSPEDSDGNRDKPPTCEQEKQPREKYNQNRPIMGFAQDVHHYGQWMLDEARRRLDSLYPPIPDSDNFFPMDVSSWIWARTVKCPDPSCGCEIPLSSSYALARKKGAETWVEPKVANGTVQFNIHRDQQIPKSHKPKVAQNASFRCPACGVITPDQYVKECGLNHQIGSRLIAVVSEDDSGKQFFSPTAQQEEAAGVEVPGDVPHGKLPDFRRRFSPPAFGMTDYASLFTSRQLVFLTTMMQLAREVQHTAEKDAVKNGLAADGLSLSHGGKGARAYAEAVRTALVMTVSKLLNRCSSLCSWDASKGGGLRSVFSRAALHMIWDYAESNPLSYSTGSFTRTLDLVSAALAHLPGGPEGKAQVHDAMQPFEVRNALLSTELPYYDRTDYADLSDFFYVWIRYGLGDLFPDWFQDELTPKDQELVSFAHRWNGSREQAESFFDRGLARTLKNLHDCVTRDYPSTVAFQYRDKAPPSQKPASSQEMSSAESDLRPDRWERFIAALWDAGFSITASWPLGRSGDSGDEATANGGTPVTMVLRRRQADDPRITRRLFVAEVRREVPSIVMKLQDMVAPADLRASAVGPALNIFTRHGEVVNADGTAMSPVQASRIIEQELDTVLAAVSRPDTHKAAGKEETAHDRES